MHILFCAVILTCSIFEVKQSPEWPIASKLLWRAGNRQSFREDRVQENGWIDDIPYFEFGLPCLLRGASLWSLPEWLLSGPNLRSCMNEQPGGRSRTHTDIVIVYPQTCHAEAKSRPSHFFSPRSEVDGNAGRRQFSMKYTIREPSKARVRDLTINQARTNGSFCFAQQQLRLFR